jgi:hypothetical protein
MLSRSVVALFAFAALSACDAVNAVCSNGPAPKMWAASIQPLVLRASTGDADAANEAYYQCTVEYNEISGDPYRPTEYTSRCGALLSLWIDDTLMSGDPKKIDDLFVSLSHMDGRGSDVSRRMTFYRDIAVAQIAKRCAAPSSPPSCKDPSLLRDIVAQGYAKR